MNAAICGTVAFASASRVTAEPRKSWNGESLYASLESGHSAGAERFLSEAN